MTLKHFAFVASFSIFFSCASEKPITTRVDFSRNTEAPNDVINITSTGYGKKPEDARYDAYRRAMDLLLYSGNPKQGSIVKDPLIANKQKALSEHESYFKDFYETEKLLSFYTNGRDVSSPEKVQDGYQVTVRTELNVRSLRRELEQAGIVRKFGL